VPTAAFLDRDGTVIRDTGYVSSPEDVVLLPGAAEAVRLLNRAGIPVVIVTNQSGIARGYFGESEFHSVQERLESLLLAAGARIDATYFCPHVPNDRCDCRKPGLGLYLKAAAELGLDLAGALYVGDRVRDVLPVLELGGKGILVAGKAGGYDDPTPPGCLRALNLLAGVRMFLPESEDYR
jgi:histidinol-phosphate phosphatase family protein